MTRVKPSPTGAVLALGAELKAAGRDIISLGTGEPDFDTPQPIKDAAIDAIQAGATKYTPIDGTAELKAAVARKFKRDNGLTYSPAEIVVTSGAKQALFNLCQGLLGPGDEAIIPSPYWVSYPDMVLLAGAEPVIVKAGLEENFRITPQQLDDAITSKTRLFILNSPSNPTGASYSETELQALGEVLAEHDQVVIASDEIYEHINFVGGHESIAQFEEIRDRVIIITGVSKGYAMTGWRIGYMAGPDWSVKACGKLQGQMTSGATSIAMRAALAALTGDQSCVTEMRDAFLRRRDLILGHVSQIEGVKCATPGGAFYVFPDLSAYIGKSVDGRKIETDMDLCIYLLEVGHIATVPGSAFGADGCVRISYANSDENLEKAMDRLKKALAALS